MHGAYYLRLSESPMSAEAGNFSTIWVRCAWSYGKIRPNTFKNIVGTPPEKGRGEHFVGAQQSCPWVPDKSEHEILPPYLIVDILGLSHAAKLVPLTAHLPAVRQAYTFHCVQNCCARALWLANINELPPFTDENLQQ